MPIHGYVLVCMVVNAWVHVACAWECAPSCVCRAVWAGSGVSGLEQDVSGIQGHSLVAQSWRLSPLLRVVRFLLSSAVQSLAPDRETRPHSLHSHFCRQLWAEAQLASFAHSQAHASSGSLSGEGGQEGEA